MEIKQVKSDEIGDVKHLVTNVFIEFEAPDYTQEGVESFFTTALNNNDFMNHLTIYGAYRDDEMIGVIATRNSGSHIALFFVSGEHHGQGIGRKLFEQVLENSTVNEITVNSSPYAKEVYHHFGFEDTDVERTVTGIRFIPMMYHRKLNNN